MSPLSDEDKKALNMEWVELAKKYILRSIDCGACVSVEIEHDGQRTTISF